MVAETPINWEIISVFWHTKNPIWHWVKIACLPTCGLTHLPLDKMAAISQTTFLNAFLWMKSVVFRFKFHWSLFLTVLFTITQHLLDNGLAPNGQQAIIWTNADPIHWRIYVALEGDELTHCCLLLPNDIRDHGQHSKVSGHLWAAKPLSEPMLTYHQRNHDEHVGMNLNWTMQWFLPIKYYWRWCF